MCYVYKEVGYNPERFTNGLNISLPRRFWDENSVLTPVKKKKSFKVSKEDHADSLLGAWKDPSVFVLLIMVQLGKVHPTADSESKCRLIYWMSLVVRERVEFARHEVNRFVMLVTSGG